MYKQHQQGLAVVLLTGFFLQSCGDNLTGAARSSLQVDRSTQNKNEESPQKEREQQHHPAPSMLDQEKLPNVKNTQTGDKNPSYSFPPTDPLKRTHPTSIDTGRQQHKTRNHILKNRSALADKIASTTLPLASLAPTEETAQTRQQAVCPLDCRQQQTANSELTAQAFTTAMGEQVRLQRIGKELWQAYVTDQIGPGSRTRCLPLVYEAHSDPQAVLTTLRAHPQRARQLLHILPTKGKIPHHPWVVHVGPLGLMGGMIRATQGEQGDEEEKRDSQAAQQEQNRQRLRLVYQGQALSIFFKEAFNDPGFLPDAIATFKGVAQVAPKRAGKYIALLKRALHNPDSGICCAALDALGALVEADPSFAPVLIEWINGIDFPATPENVRGKAIAALKTLSEVAPSEALRELLLEHAWITDGGSLSIITQSLGKMVSTAPWLASQEIGEALLKIISDSPANHRCAINALGALVQAAPELASKRMGDSLLQLVKGDDRRSRWAASQALCKLVQAAPDLVSEEALHRLLYNLRTNYSNQFSGACEPFCALVRAAPNLIELVYKKAKEGSDPQWTTEMSAQLLTVISNTAGRYRREESNYALWEAVRALGALIEIAPRRVVNPQVLSGLLTAVTDRDNDVRHAAVKALTAFLKVAPELVNPSVGTALLRATEDRRKAVRLATFQALGVLAKSAPLMANEQMLAKLLRAVKGDSRGAFDITCAAIAALESFSSAVPGMANTRVCAALLKAAGHPHHAIRCAAIKALGQLLLHMPVQQLKIFPPLLKALTDPSINVRRAANDTLVLLAKNSPAHVERVFAAFARAATEDSREYVRFDSLDSLSRLAQSIPDCAEKVLTVFSDTVRDTSTVVRCVSIQTLGQLAQVAPSYRRAALALLSSATEDANEEVCNAAIEAIEQVRMVQHAT